MSGFTDMMIDDGFSDPYEYMEYLEILASKVMDSFSENDDEMRNDYSQVYGQYLVENEFIDYESEYLDDYYDEYLDDEGTFFDDWDLPYRKRK